jgi:hypothetical protein
MLLSLPALLAHLLRFDAQRVGMSRKQVREREEQERSLGRKAPSGSREPEDAGLEGVCADPEDASIVREGGVEGGEDLSIGGGPPGSAQTIHPE